MRNVARIGERQRRGTLAVALTCKQRSTGGHAVGIQIEADPPVRHERRDEAGIERIAQKASVEHDQRPRPERQSHPSVAQRTIAAATSTGSSRCSASTSSVQVPVMRE